MSKILITGAKGMLAHDLIPVLETDHELMLTDVSEMDITDSSSIFSVFEWFGPDVVINCAAYTAVDKAEDEWKMINYRVNALWVGELAKACAKFGSELIHISTDYVFEGNNEEWYLPDDTPAPLNEYGMAKRLGEQLARQHLPSTVIVRTAWLYGGWVEFPNFVNTMIRLWKEKESLKVVDDQHGLPTYTVDLAHALDNIVKDIEMHRWATLHLTNAGEKSISWYDFTKEIHAQAGIECDLQPCWSEQYLRPAARPNWSELKNKSELEMPEWKEGLGRYLERVKR